MNSHTAGRAAPSAPPAWATTLFDAHPHAVLVCDASARLLHANRAAQALLPHGQAQSLFDVLEPPRREAAAQALDAALRDGDEWKGVVTATGTDGTSGPAWLRVLAAPGDAAERICIVECQHVPEQLPALLWKADDDFALEWASPAMAEFTGRRWASLLDRHWLECIHPDDRERCLAIFSASRQVRLPFSMDLRVHRHDGAYRVHLFCGAPIPGGYAGVAVDIDERSPAESGPVQRTELRRHGGEPGNGQFLANLAHELRNPLAPITNVASVLRTLEDGSPTLIRLREILERQVATLRRTLDELVDVTQALTGDLTIAGQTLRLHDVVQAALAEQQRRLNAMDQRVLTNLSPRSPTVDGDPLRLTQMMSALLANASKFSPAGAAIELDVHIVDGAARAAVKNPGRGISADFLPRVFDLFAQEKGEARGGMGVGLTLAKRIAQLHGGDLQAHSDGVGCGAKFVVTLPLAATQLER